VAPQSSQSCHRALSRTSTETLQRAGWAWAHRLQRRHGSSGPAPELEWFWRSYLGDEALRSDITVSPLQATQADLEGLPPALVIVGQNDVLRDQGEAYADKLRDAGVPTTSVRFNGTIHDFMRLNALRDTESTRAAIDLAVAALRRAYGTY
jgi:acetyl esterase